MKILTKRQLIMLHGHLIGETGGTDGLRDEGLLESALAAPFQAFGSYRPYPTLGEKAARLGYGLVKNHPFADGNKRIGAHAMLTLLALNGVMISCAQEELVDIIIGVAAGSAGYGELLQWLTDHRAPGAPA